MTYLEDRTIEATSQNATTLSIHPTVTIAGTVNEDKGFGIAQVFVAGHMTGHIYTGASVEEVTAMMDRLELEVLAAIAKAAS